MGWGLAVVANQPIKPHDEILSDYGTEYLQEDRKRGRPKIAKKIDK